MEDTTTEWEIVALAAGWMNSLFDAHKKANPFKECRVEKTTSGSRKRRDMTILNHEGHAVVTGEVKIPWAEDGHSPFVESVVLDARNKAARAGVDFFFTWNINQLVVWRRSLLPEHRGERGFQLFEIANVQNVSHTLNPRIIDEIRDGIERFTLKLIELVRENQPLPLRSPDDYFVLALESFLKRPIEETKVALKERDANERRRNTLDKWMREDQGWTLGEDRDDLIDRAAKFASYATANKLVFYEALKKRFALLPSLRFESSVRSGDEAIEKLEGFFGRAKRTSNDYETVFGFDRTDFGNQIPFLSNAAVDGWRGVLDHVDKFDFTQLDYDVIGRIFERLIAPEERHKYGQYYTRPEIVDVINAFCIQQGSARVLDPGCGGGTFLVRAYARKKYLSPDLSHIQLLANIFGTDISHFASHLATINLATRELVDERNYPRVKRIDFFDVGPDKPLIELPYDDGEGLVITPRRFDAIVANPPYVRQEDISPNKKTKYSAMVKADAALKASGRSDLHVYFWGHALSLLKPSGCLGFLTSSQWLDVDYGFALQEWLLNHFKIIAILESQQEPWFEGARVATVATIAERTDDAKVRANNVIRFVELRKPIAELVYATNSREMLLGAERIRDDILKAARDQTTAEWRIRCVRQADLLDQGLALGERMKGKRVYAGGKWGIPLRAPEIWFDLLAAGGNRWRPLGEIADVRFGVKSGRDDFFYLDDMSEEALDNIADPNPFQQHYGVPRSSVVTKEVILARVGTGEVFPIERHFLTPIVHSLMHVDHYEVGLENCEKLALMVPSNKPLKGTLVGKYIAWGEKQKYHLGATCAARESNAGRRWFDLTDAIRVPVLWVKERQYRFAAPINDQKFLANCRLYTIDTKSHEDVMGGVLNSSIAILSTLMFGRPVGVEAGWSTMVSDVQMMLVPDWTRTSTDVRNRITAAAMKLRKRSVLGMISERRLREKSFTERHKKSQLELLSTETELDQIDRRELDDAVLTLLGVSSARERKLLLDRLYEHLRSYFEKERRKEEEAIDNKKRTKARQRQTPDTLAQAVFALVGEQQPRLLRTYEDFSDSYGYDAISDARFVPWPDKVELVDDLLGVGVKYRSRKTGKFDIVRANHREQAQLIIEISNLGEGGDTYFLPSDRELCKKLSMQLREHMAFRESKVRELLEDRTSDPDLVDKALSLVMPRFRPHKPAE
jgi:type I restriction-modification system DNA methylase subunit